MQSSDFQGPGVGEKELTSKGHEQTFWRDGNVLYLVCGKDYILCILTKKSLSNPHLKWVSLTESKLMPHKTT